MHPLFEELFINTDAAELGHLKPMKLIPGTIRW
jgi:hypothetical protein